MAISDVQKTVLQIINEVERKLSIDASGTLTARKLTTTLLDYLNDVIAEVSDYGDWQEMYREVSVTGQSGVGEYKVVASAEVKNVYEIHHSARGVSPLQNRSISDIRRLQKLSGGGGVPHQYALVGVSGTRPKFRVFNVPGAAQDGQLFDVAFYKKPRIYTTNDANTRVPFPSRVLVAGLYAKALLEETGQEPTNQYQVAYAEYTRMRKEALNRFTADTNGDVYINPVGRRY